MTVADSGADDRDLAWYADDLLRRGIRRIHVLAWRDLDDPEAGGSEAHADEFMRRWAEHGLEVTHRTSHAVGLPDDGRRHGYRVIRRGSRYSVFPRPVAAEIAGRMGGRDALVEIWNGVPWFSPIWNRTPSITVFHHVHGPMWDQVFPRPFNAVGRALEAQLAPPFYRRGLTVTPSDATREELLELGFRPERVISVPNGIGAAYSPGGQRTEHPSLVAVGRLAPVKRFDLVIAAAAEARVAVPDVTLTIVGDGPERPLLEQQIADLGASGWVTLAGRLSDAELLDRYRDAWLVVSGSLAEGWGLSLTEGAACGTPAVATDIRGHRSSVIDGHTGVLATPEQLGSTIAAVLTDDDRRRRLGDQALERAQTLTWDASALGVTRCLHAEVDRRHRRSSG